jgi:FtsP/CotA-like multicopper oxidase with cupredoxin domain
MTKKSKPFVCLLALVAVLSFSLPCIAATHITLTRIVANIPPVPNPCPRGNAGDVIRNPPALYSSNGVLQVNFSYQTTSDSYGRTLFCFMTPQGVESPTLHVNPGDHLKITVTNNTPDTPVMMSINPPNCGDNVMKYSSMNIHYHGTNTAPTCGSDEVIKTTINSGQTFQYDVAFPSDEPPGLYWYHPHIHGLAEAAVQGGASGAIIVDGIENIQPAVSGLRQKLFVVRDQNVPGNPNPTGTIPSWDVSVNYIPITSCQTCNPIFTPAILKMYSGEQQFWRVTNSAADTILDLQYQFDGVPQTIQLVAVDGVSLNSQDGTQPPQLVPVTHFRLPPASRVEFIASAPPLSVKLAQLMTLDIDTGPDGDNDPQRPLATVKVVQNDDSGGNDDRVGTFRAWTNVHQRFGGLAKAPVTTKRKLYFSEIQPTTFFITVQGAKPQIFDPNAPPAITTTQGSVEDWTIENRALENHEFHFHQIHFLVLSQNNFPINGATPAPGINGQYLDMIEIPYWDGNPKHPYPSVTVRMDFRGADIGDFVYHCHILGHEDLGMMQIIRVLPNPNGAKASKSGEPSPSTPEAKPSGSSSPAGATSSSGGNGMNMSMKMP